MHNCQNVPLGAEETRLDNFLQFVFSAIMIVCQVASFINMNREMFVTLGFCCLGKAIQYTISLFFLSNLSSLIRYFINNWHCQPNLSDSELLVDKP